MPRFSSPNTPKITAVQKVEHDSTPILKPVALPLPKPAPINVEERSQKRTLSNSSPVVIVKRKRVILQSDSEPDTDDTASEVGTEKNDYDEIETLRFFNEGTFEELNDFANCTQAQYEVLVQLRPLKTFKALEEKLEVTKGLRLKLVEDYQDAMQCYRVMDDVIEQCLLISTDLQTEIAKFSNDVQTQVAQMDVAKFSPQKDGHIVLEQPSLINQELRLKDYQMVGINWLWLMHRKNLSCILADSMGLGKTAQVIAFLALLKEKGIEAPSLIVVPASTLQNWIREFARWCPALDVRAYSGSQNERAELRNELLQHDYDVLLTTYQMMNAKDDRVFLKRSRFQYMILDEGHLIKNIQSQRNKNLMSVRTPYRILLTGTPLQNSLQELLALLIFIMPDLFADSENELRKLFSFKSDSKVTLERINKAKYMLAPFILRRKKEQVLKDLPKKTEKILRLKLDSQQLQFYETYVAQSKAQLSEEKNVSNILMQLRKLALHPLLSSGDSAFHYPSQIRKNIAIKLFRKTEYYSWSGESKKTKSELENEAILDVASMMDYQIAQVCEDFTALKQHRLEESVWFGSIKIQVLLDIIALHAQLLQLQDCSYRNGNVQLEPKTGKAEKILVFSQFVMMLDVIEHCLQELDVNYVRLDGSTPVAERQVAMDCFEQDQDVAVFLLSTKAGGVGLNLMAASVVVLFDQDFNPFNDIQAEDRAYRIGQTRDITVYKLIVQNTIEERIYELAQQKINLDRTISDEIIDNDMKVLARSL